MMRLGKCECCGPNQEPILYQRRSAYGYIVGFPGFLPITSNDYPVLGDGSGHTDILFTPSSLDLIVADHEMVRNPLTYGMLITYGVLALYNGSWYRYVGPGYTYVAANRTVGAGVIPDPDFPFSGQNKIKITSGPSAFTNADIGRTLVMNLSGGGTRTWTISAIPLAPDHVQVNGSASEAYTGGYVIAGQPEDLSANPDWKNTAFFTNRRLWQDPANPPPRYQTWTETTVVTIETKDFVGAQLNTSTADYTVQRAFEVIDTTPQPWDGTFGSLRAKQIMVSDQSDSELINVALLTHSEPFRLSGVIYPSFPGNQNGEALLDFAITDTRAEFHFGRAPSGQNNLPFLTETSGGVGRQVYMKEVRQIVEVSGYREIGQLQSAGYGPILKWRGTWNGQPGCAGFDELSRNHYLLIAGSAACGGYPVQIYQEQVKGTINKPEWVTYANIPHAGAPPIAFDFTAPLANTGGDSFLMTPTVGIKRSTVCT